MGWDTVHNWSYGAVSRVLKAYLKLPDVEQHGFCLIERSTISWNASAAMKLSCYEAVSGDKVLNGDFVEPDKLRVNSSVQRLEEDSRVVFILSTAVVSPDD